ncbi:tripartite tricarboxylate transporter TctB family protein [Falsigemmobacter intermedius]|uniref:Tripartite tricarboxylate transporter TctB family protein n=1 Tax=Falsigemmobacter intermedius TaxID=1553448 RepID=A0A3S3UV77_9RHOB|nr:tripartite tricarboxylate transporter TctB family protein [Falsigemmobacter intermedius]RWY40982.1 tripartite tricarboxylate transporter TctB family protein [Falsigemmobacter intermedius]
MTDDFKGGAAMIAIRSPKFFWNGAIFLATGLFGLSVAQNYSFGTTARIGPGFFPAIVSGLLVVVGLLTILKSLRSHGEPVGRIHWKPLLLITLSVICFGLLLPRIGLPLTILASCITAAVASTWFRFAAVPALLALAFAALCTLAFSIGLGLPMLVLGSWLQPLAELFTAARTN